MKLKINEEEFPSLQLLDPRSALFRQQANGCFGKHILSAKGLMGFSKYIAGCW